MLEITSGRLVVSATKPVAMMKASAALGENSRLARIAITIGVSSSAAPSLAKKAAIAKPSSTISGNSTRPRPRPQRTTCSAAQRKKPASSSSSEMMMSATKVKVAFQTMCQTVGILRQWMTPRARSITAPAMALQPMPKPRGCQMTNTRVAMKTARASIEKALFLRRSADAAAGWCSILRCRAIISASRPIPARRAGRVRSPSPRSGSAPCRALRCSPCSGSMRRWRCASRIWSRCTRRGCDHLISTASRDAHGRIAHLLVELYFRQTHRLPHGRGETIALPLTLALIGEAVALTTEHASRTLRRLREEGVIRLRRGQLLICDPDALIRASGVAERPLADARPPIAGFRGPAGAKPPCLPGGVSRRVSLRTSRLGLGMLTEINDRPPTVPYAMVPVSMAPGRGGQGMDTAHVGLGSAMAYSSSTTEAGRALTRRSCVTTAGLRLR